MYVWCDELGIVSSVECGTKKEDEGKQWNTFTSWRLEASRDFPAASCMDLQCSTWKASFTELRLLFFAILKEETQSCDRLRNIPSQTVLYRALRFLWAHSLFDFLYFLIIIIKWRCCKNAPWQKKKKKKACSVSHCLH